MGQESGALSFPGSLGTMANQIFDLRYRDSRKHEKGAAESSIGKESLRALIQVPVDFNFDRF